MVRLVGQVLGHNFQAERHRPAVPRAMKYPGLAGQGRGHDCQGICTGLGAIGLVKSPCQWTYTGICTPFALKLTAFCWERVDDIYEFHPGGNPGKNIKSTSHICQLIMVALVWELTEEIINLLLGCLQGGYDIEVIPQDHVNEHLKPTSTSTLQKSIRVAENQRAGLLKGLGCYKRPESLFSAMKIDFGRCACSTKTTISTRSTL